MKVIVLCLCLEWLLQFVVFLSGRVNPACGLPVWKGHSSVQFSCLEGLGFMCDCLPMIGRFAKRI